MNLQELAEKHLFSTVEFYCDEQQNAFMEGLRALIREVAGEDVARVQVEGDMVEWNPNIELDLAVGTKLYAIPKEILE